MKKHEMEYYIAGILSTMYETDQHPENQLPNARALLEALEEAGMLPPVKKHCPVLLITSYVWETENDV